MIPRFVNILPTNTTIAARSMSTFSFCPKYVNKIDRIAFPKKPVTNIFKSNFLFSTATSPPKIESSAATIAIAKYPEYV